MRILGQNVLLEPLPEQTVSDGGIHLPPAQVGDMKMYWRVLALGPLVPADVAASIAVGSTVITPLHFSHHSMEDSTGRKIAKWDQLEGVLVAE